MTELHRIVYMCEVCLTASDKPIVHHGHLMTECDAGCIGDDCTQPVSDEAGHILTRAPKWWVFRHRRAHSPLPR